MHVRNVKTAINEMVGDMSASNLDATGQLVEVIEYASGLLDILTNSDYADEEMPKAA